ncbi:hypothetical protein FB446DRAFT_709891 [Lentinula raphanica]|nr:hypothetical protein FB446DRAFT_709891 [Lentinula raphanica]
MSSPMADADILASFAIDLFMNTLNVICFLALFGMYIFATLIALKLLLTSKPRSTQKFVLLLLTSLLVVINVLGFLQTIIPLFILLKRTLMVPLDGGLLEQSTAAQNALLPWITISDLLVIWRAIAIWNGNHYVQWALLPLMTCTGVMNVVEAICADLLSFNGVKLEQINAACIFMSLATNTIATALIALRLWIYRRSMHTILGSYRSTTIQRLLLLLVESGAVFFIIQFASAVVNFEATLGSHGQFSFQLAYTTFYQFFAEICAEDVLEDIHSSFLIQCLYPVAVVIMIHSQSSVVEASTLSVATAAQEFQSGDSTVDEFTRNS